MSGVCEIRDRLLRDGKITSNEVAALKEYVIEDGVLDYQDIKFLVGLMKEAKSVCEEFDEVLFPAMRHVFLADGTIGMDEQYLLLQMLYSDGEVRDAERGFISELYREVENVTPEFQSLCETALNSDSKGWSLD
jgi:hypothetical protein